MKVANAYGWPQALALVCALVRVQASDLFVAPGGTPAGPGTPSLPYDLTTALSGAVGRPGDTFWLRGGNYSVGHVDTIVQGSPGRPITFRGVTGERARIDGTLTLYQSTGFVVFRDFELFSSNSNRVSSQVNAGFNPTDISIIPGLACYVPNVSFINLLVHDQTRHGIYLNQDTAGNLVYGCILYDNGWVAPDNAEGHGIYSQGNTGTRTLQNNIAFNNSGANFHIYENTNGGSLQGMTLDGNVAFNAGAIQNVRTYRDWLVGVDLPAAYADRIVFQNNLGYEARGGNSYLEVQIGRDSTNGSLVLANNYMPLGLQMSNWRNATVTGNLFAPKPTTYVVNLNETLTDLDADWDENTYVCDPTGGQVLFNQQGYSFSGWQAATGFDSDSTFVMGDLHGTKVFVVPNRFEMGRAMIVIYNWDNLNMVSANVASVLPMNSAFEVRNVQDFFAPPVLTGVYHGQLLQLPMANLTVASPNGQLLTPPPTGPTFNVFLVRRIPPPIQIKTAGGWIQVSWNIGAGPEALQTSVNAADPGSWTYSNVSPTIVGDQFSITEPASLTARFYRLHPTTQ